MTTRANIYVQPELWLRFRVHCMQTHTTASKEIMRMITARMGEVETPTLAPVGKKPLARKAKPSNQKENHT